MFALVISISAFIGGAPTALRAPSSVSMSLVSRRELTSLAGAALAMAPLSALADGATTSFTRQRAFTIYGARILAIDRLINARSAFVGELVDLNAIQLFITGAIPKGSAQQNELVKIKATIVKAAKDDDAVALKSALDNFITVGKIRDISEENTYARNERRNLGAPTNSFVAKQTGRSGDFFDRNAPKAAPAPAPAPAAAEAAPAL